MLDSVTVDKLRAIAGQVRSILPGVAGSVEIKLPPQAGQVPIVDVRVCDVTRVKK